MLVLFFGLPCVFSVLKALLHDAPSKYKQHVAYIYGDMAESRYCLY